MTKKLRILSLIIAGIILLVILCSPIGSSSETEHECAGDGCAVCSQISIYKDTIKSLSLVAYTASFTTILCCFLCKSFFLCTNFIPSLTLVSLKVKLSN